MQKAKWIWQNNSNNKDEYVNFIDEFIAEKKDKITLKISCDTDYTVYINGNLLGFGQYSDYPYYKVYDEINITKFVKKGKNRIAICGYYVGESFFTYYGDNAGIIFEIEEKGNIIACSNENTKCRLACDYINYKKIKITSQLGFLYHYDMSNYDNWNKINYDYSNFDNSEIIYNMPEKLHKRLNKKLVLESFCNGKLIKTGYFKFTKGDTYAEKQQNAEIIYDADIKGNNITVKQGGVYALYDLGREEVGFLNLKININKKTNISIGYGEHIADGRVRTCIDGRNFAIGYTSKIGEQKFTNTFRRFGARYLQIFAETNNIDIQEIGLVPVMYPLIEKQYKAKNELRQKIYDTSVRTLRLCMHEHYEDCPWREQSMYTLDGRNQMLCGYYAFKETDMARASLKLIGMGKRNDGLLSICCPSKSKLAIPSFSLYYIMQMYDYMKYTKDKTLAIELYDKMESILNTFNNRIENGLVPIFYNDENYWNFYEWQEGLSGNLFKKDEKAFDVILNSLLSIALKNMELISIELQKDEKANYYKKLYININKAINKEFYDKETNLYITKKGKKNYSELGNCLVVICGAAEKTAINNIAKKLIKQNNNMTKLTLSMMCFKYDALLIANKEKYKDYVLEDIDKVYGYMLEQGATSFWETLKGDSDFDNAGSLCHGWSAMPVYYYNILR